MSDSLWPLIAIALLFVGTHLGVSAPPLRARLVARLGKQAFRGLYSVFSIGLLVALIWAFEAAPFVALWNTAGLAWVPVLVMPVAFVLVVGAASARNPTLTGAEEMGWANGAAPLSLFVAVTRHPMLWGIGLWALAHIAANGDAAALIFFGAMAALCFAGMAGIDAKKRRDPEFDFAAFAERTSLIPFAATLAGRNRLQASWADAARIVAGVVLYGAVMSIHIRLFGVSPYPV